MTLRLQATTFIVLPKHTREQVLRLASWRRNGDMVKHQKRFVWLTANDAKSVIFFGTGVVREGICVVRERRLKESMSQNRQP